MSCVCRVGDGLVLLAFHRQVHHIRIFVIEIAQGPNIGVVLI